MYLFCLAKHPLMASLIPSILILSFPFPQFIVKQMPVLHAILFIHISV